MSRYSFAVPCCLITMLLTGCGDNTRTDAWAGDEEEVRERVEMFGQAFVRADADALAEMLTDDYVHTNTNGSVLDKETWLTWIRQRHLEIESGKISIDHYENEDVEVRLYGKTAVVTGKNISEGVREGEPFRTFLRFTNVWVDMDEAWRRAAFHDSKISE